MGPLFATSRAVVVRAFDTLTQRRARQGGGKVKGGAMTVVACCVRPVERTFAQAPIEAANVAVR
jgi:hypothetical protein